jgi:hypothetical protein
MLIGCLLINPLEPADNSYNLIIGFIMIGLIPLCIFLIGSYIILNSKTC